MTNFTLDMIDKIGMSTPLEPDEGVIVDNNTTTNHISLSDIISNRSTEKIEAERKSMAYLESIGALIDNKPNKSSNVKTLKLKQLLSESVAVMGDLGNECPNDLVEAINKLQPILTKLIGRLK